MQINESDVRSSWVNTYWIVTYFYFCLSRWPSDVCKQKEKVIDTLCLKWRGTEKTSLAIPSWVFVSLAFQEFYITALWCYGNKIKLVWSHICATMWVWCTYSNSVTAYYWAQSEVRHLKNNVGIESLSMVLAKRLALHVSNSAIRLIKQCKLLQHWSFCWKTPNENSKLTEIVSYIIKQ